MKLVDVYISKESYKILADMAKENCVSLTTELETAIADRYRMTHGFEGLTKTREIERLQRELAECDRRIQNAKLLSSVE